MFWTMLAVIFFLCVALAAKRRTIAFLRDENERLVDIAEGGVGVRGKNAVLQFDLDQMTYDRDSLKAELDMAGVHQRSLGEDLAGFDRRIIELSSERETLTQEVESLRMKMKSSRFIADTCLTNFITMGSGVIHQPSIPVPESTEPPHFTA
jgi:hypothetical protein